MTALSASILLTQALLHGHLSGIDEYDDGVYFGSAMQLTHGTIPYRDFGFIQPPFIAVLLSPFAFASHLIGTARAFESARLFIVAIEVANTALVGVLMRRRPVFQMVIAMGVMAVYPGAVSSAQTILLEPVLVCLCLVGLVALFDGDCVSRSHRRIFIAGAFFGLAASTKLWALGPIVIVAYLLWRKYRLRHGQAQLSKFLLGVGTGFSVVCLPFFLGAPRNFIDQVFVTQAVRNGSGYGIPERILDLTGTAGIVHFFRLPIGISAGLFVSCGFVGVICLTQREKGRGLSDLEWTSLLCALGVAVVLIASPTYYYHYSSFEAPFLALSLAFICGRLVARVRNPPKFTWRLNSHQLASVAILAIVPIVLCVSGVADIARIVGAMPATQVNDAFSDAIPSRGCVLYVDPSIALLDNRYTSDVSNCPDVVDYLGEERVLDGGLSDTPSDMRQTTLQKQMLNWVSSSDALVTGDNEPSWGPAVRRYVSNHFEATRGLIVGTEVYVRRSRHSI